MLQNEPHSKNQIPISTALYVFGIPGWEDSDEKHFFWHRHAALFRAPGVAAIGRAVEAALQWQGLHRLDRPGARRQSFPEPRRGRLENGGWHHRWRTGRAESERWGSRFAGAIQRLRAWRSTSCLPSSLPPRTA